MKFDFTYYNPTKIIFGKDSLNHLEEELSAFGPNVLLAYGGGSIKKIGLYDRVVEILKRAKKNIFELSKIMPNPTYRKVTEGAFLVRNHHIDLILRKPFRPVRTVRKKIRGMPIGFVIVRFLIRLYRLERF